MGKFIAGLIIGAAALAAATFCYAYFGYIDPRGDVQAGPIESWISMPALDASLRRHAPNLTNPVHAGQPDLLAGMNLYQSHCANCHGDPAHPTAALANSFEPPPPQFMKEAPDMPAYQNFFVIQHGIRWTGMPAWGHILSEQQMWQLTTFLGRMPHLPQPVEAEWESVASAPPAH